MTAAGIEELRERDQLVVEAALPAHMMYLMVEECQKIGVELRADVQEKLNLAAVAPLTRLDELSVSRTAKRIDELARTLLHDLSPDDPRDGLYSCAMFCLTLVDEGFLHDRTNQAVLVSLLLMSDLEDDRKDEAGEEAVWRMTQARWKSAAGKLHVRAALQGVYNIRRH
ncbi:hypothetical protein [Nitratireductor sp. OM-1]|uniref:hypothetical protein n=1 Tax=Nitratireductor sp. OM-1 TaxID=1756988 RepID=UPI000DDCC47A|nr:hypothetical protein [Nitratireductor sp. OM-1]